MEPLAHTQGLVSHPHPNSQILGGVASTARKRWGAQGKPGQAPGPGTLLQAQSTRILALKEGCVWGRQGGTLSVCTQWWAGGRSGCQQALN